jgi:hypothetical protein
MPDLDALQKNVDLTRDLRFVKSSIDIKKYSDLSIVQKRPNASIDRSILD